VLVGGYHGWHDWYVGTTTRDFGVPPAVKELTSTFAFGDVPSVGPDVAAVILEPGGVVEPEPRYLQSVVDAAHAAGALVVFDEIITGFRLAPGGAQERYGVRADLVTFGKALGNGMPISALAGRAELMQRLEDVFFSGTHGGETLSLAAARATLDELTPDAFAALHSKGERLRTAVQRAIDSTGVGDWVSIGGAAPRTVVLIREPAGPAPGLMARSLVQQEMLKRGVLFNGNNFICLAHSDEDLDQAADAYEAAFARLADGLSSGDIAGMLEGEPVQPAFRPVA
jgi:glutamate-1-semialdehyde aminotransferase